MEDPSPLTSRSYPQRARRGKESNPDDQTCCVRMISSVGKASAVLNAVIGGSGLSLSAFAFTAQHAGISSRSHAKSGCGRLFMMESASSTHELFVLARLTNKENKGAIMGKTTQERLKSLSSTMGGRYGHRVAFDPVTEEGACSALHLGEVSCDLPVFRLVRDGLVVDEYHGHGNHMFEEELHKRIEAALSLSRKDDSSTLKQLWSPDVAGLYYRDEMAVATYAVQVASTIARELQEDLGRQGAISKMDSSPVTIADFSVQAIVLSLLHRYFPNYGFIAEETSAVLRQDPAALAAVFNVVRRALHTDLTVADLCVAIDLGSRGHERHGRGVGKAGRTWVLDPIDGTKGFLRGEQFCVALGLLEGGKAVAGLLGCPNLPVEDEVHPETCNSGGKSAGSARGLLYSAVEGQGTFVRSLACGGEDTHRVMVDHARRPCETCVLESAEPSHTSYGVAKDVCHDLGVHLAPIRMDGQCKYGLLSQGQGGIYLRIPRWGYEENIWDHVAGAVIIQVVGIIATNGKIHDEVVQAVHNRQMEDWARVVAETKEKGWENGGSMPPPLPGVDWDFGGEHGHDHLCDDWWATAMAQRDPLVMRTSGQFYGALRRGWDRLVAVLFHGSWTVESQHAVGVLQQLAGRQRRLHHYSFPPKSPRPRDGLTDGEGGTAVVLAEADVMSLIEVADHQAIAALPSLHLYLGGRELVRFTIETGESTVSVGACIDEIAKRVERATARQ